ncbi:MAG: histidine phosphatase family protein [Desulfobacterales bacterium]|jgi:probable phosphoglycerate mutase
MAIEAVSTRFGLIRHAQTHWNREGRIQGHGDSSLTESGKKEADAWGRHLKCVAWDRLLGSDLGRAVDTAAIINQHLQIPFETDARLREQDWGEWTAKPADTIKNEDLQKLDEDQRSGWLFRPPGGEDRISVWQRSHNALVAAARKWPGNTILVVTHEGVIRNLIYRLCNRIYAPGESTLIESRHLHWLMIRKSGLQLDQINALMLPKTAGEAP